MKLLSLWAEANVKAPFVSLVTIVVLMIGASDALAYEEYSDCESCHGGFTESPYNPPSGGTDWGDDLHDVHRDLMLNRDCDTCHSPGPRTPVIIDSSSGGDGLAAISCMGCHGRDQDMGNDSLSAGRGAGLRQHHSNASVTACQGCHSDANPANYTPVGEDVLPNYYASPGTDHPAIPSHSCNHLGDEDFEGTPSGLDNDGDGAYDMADANCEGVPVELMTFEVE